MAEGSAYSIAEVSAAQNTFLQQQVTTVMRSFKDELSFNLQTLNLTLNGLTSSMNNLNSKIGALDPNLAGRYISAGLNSNTYLGSVSPQTANYTPFSSLPGPNMDYRRPFNISPQEYYTNTALNRSTIPANFASSVLASTIPGMYQMGATLVGANPNSDSMLGRVAGLGQAVLNSGVQAGTTTYLDQARMLTRMGGRFDGVAPTWAEARSAAQGIQKLAFQEGQTADLTKSRLGEQGYRDITMAGLQGDVFHGTDLSQLVSQVQQLGEVVKVITGILGSPDTKSAMESIIQLKNMGMNTSNGGAALKREVQQIAGNAFGYGFNNSINPADMLKAGIQVAQSGFGTQNIPALAGVNFGMHNLAQAMQLQHNGTLTPVDVAMGGGVQSIASRMTGHYGQLLNSDIGTMYLSAGLTSNGKFDISRANDVAAGQNIYSLTGAGLKNMIGGDSVLSGMDAITRMNYVKVNRNNLIDQLDDKGVIPQLKGYSDIMNGYMKSSIVGYDNMSLDHKRINGAAVLMDQGYGAAESKAIMNQVLDPTASRRLAMEAQTTESLADYSQAIAKTSPEYQLDNAISLPVGRWISRQRQDVVEGVENAINKVSNFFVSPNDNYRTLTSQDLSGIYSTNTIKDNNGVVRSYETMDNAKLNLAREAIMSEEQGAITTVGGDQALARLAALDNGNGTIGERLGGMINAGVEFIKHPLSFENDYAAYTAAERSINTLNRDLVEAGNPINEITGRRESINTYGEQVAALDRSGIDISAEKLQDLSKSNNRAMNLTYEALREGLSGDKIEGEARRIIGEFDASNIAVDETLQQLIRDNKGASPETIIQTITGQTNGRYTTEEINQQMALMGEELGLSKADLNAVKLMSSTEGKKLVSSTITNERNVGNYDAGREVGIADKMLTSVMKATGLADRVDKNILRNQGEDFMNSSVITESDLLTKEDVWEGVDYGDLMESKESRDTLTKNIIAQGKSEKEAQKIVADIIDYKDKNAKNSSILDTLTGSSTDVSSGLEAMTQARGAGRHKALGDTIKAFGFDYGMTVDKDVLQDEYLSVANTNQGLVAGIIASQSEVDLKKEYGEEGYKNIQKKQSQIKDLFNQVKSKSITTEEFDKQVKSINDSVINQNREVFNNKKADSTIEKLDSGKGDISDCIVSEQGHSAILVKNAENVNFEEAEKARDKMDAAAQSGDREAYMEIFKSGTVFGSGRYAKGATSTPVQQAQNSISYVY